MRSSLLLIGLFLLLLQKLHGQEKQYRVICVGFYNFENLFDTQDDPENWGDDEFLPAGSKNWNEEKYREKLSNLAGVVNELGAGLTSDGPAILGVAEVENRKVLEDFAGHPGIRHRDYQIIHYESPDHRGIDVGLLYQPKYFKPLSSRPISMKEGPSNHGDSLLTRDILYVSGILDGDTIHVLVNHWPSRSGGESATTHLREYAAGLNRETIESIKKIDKSPKIIIMGDLNDDPSSPSLKNVLTARKDKRKTPKGGLYNPMYRLYQKGIGSNAWRDAWNLFDQLVVSQTLIDKKTPGYRFYQAHVHNKPYLTQKSGQYQGYPFRTFAGDNYLAGYSDHFPVYLYLIKETATP